MLVSLLCATQVHSEALDPILLKFMGVHGPHSQFAESAHATYFPGLVAEVNDDVDHFVIGFEGFADFHGGSTTKKDGGLDLQIGTPINGNIMPYVRIGLTASWPHTRLHDGGGVEYKFAKAWGVAGEYAGDTTQCRDGPGYEAHSHRAAWQRRHQRRQSRARRLAPERPRDARAATSEASSLYLSGVLRALRSGPSRIARQWLFDIDRWRRPSFYRRDHGPRDGSDLAAWMRTQLAAAGIEEADGSPSIRARCSTAIFNVRSTTHSVRSINASPIRSICARVCGFSKSAAAGAVWRCTRRARLVACTSLAFGRDCA